jgi:hypothetical protein
MSDTEKTQSRKTAASTDGGKKELQAAFDEAQEKGYFGVTPDPTPNENYTLKGVASGKPTPETDDALADELAANQRKLAREGKL